jgi:hypothetical protein
MKEVTTFLSGIPKNHNFQVDWSLCNPIGESLTVFVTDANVFHSSEPVIDLDWTATPDGQSVLAIGFPHHVLLLYQQRMTYFEQEPRWGVFGKIEIGRFVILTLNSFLNSNSLPQYHSSPYQRLHLDISSTAPYGCRPPNDSGKTRLRDKRWDIL